MYNQILDHHEYFISEGNTKDKKQKNMIKRYLKKLSNNLYTLNKINEYVDVINNPNDISINDIEINTTISNLKKLLLYIIKYTNQIDLIINNNKNKSKYYYNFIIHVLKPKIDTKELFKKIINL